MELAAVWAWFDNEPSLRVAVVTGAGKAFCSGADLKGEKKGFFWEGCSYGGVERKERI